mmetsp:Transcript_80460/g.139650  ORF Transcript_80460/g.139650 Transcript_80460/m.139650 type:complete len:369 (+) Transcript_80460:66-1172(+)
MAAASTGPSSVVSTASCDEPTSSPAAPAVASPAMAATTSGPGAVVASPVVAATPPAPGAVVAAPIVAATPPAPGAVVASLVVAATPPAPAVMMTSPAGAATPRAPGALVTSPAGAATPRAPGAVVAAPVVTTTLPAPVAVARTADLARTPSAPVLNGSSTYRASTVVTRSLSPRRRGMQAPGAAVMPTSGSYVSPPIIVSSGSYVAAPVTPIMRPIMTEPPKSLTEGLAPPATIEQQKEESTRAVDGQFSQATSQLIESSQARKQMFIQSAQQQKAQYRIKVQAQLEAQYLALDQAMNARIFELQDMCQQQKAGLEQQAALLTLEYQQKKAEEEMRSKQFQIQRNYHEASRGLAMAFEKTRDLKMFKA